MSIRSILYSAGRQFIHKYDKTTHAAIRSFQPGDLSYLNDVLRYAKQHVPFYDFLKLLSPVTESLGPFQSLPSLTKTHLREQFDALKSDEQEGRSAFSNSSGGSTGKPCTFLQDHEFVSWSVATLAHYYQNFLGIDEASVPKVILWGSERDTFKQGRGLKTRVAYALSQTTFLNSFKMSAEEMREYVRIINKQKPVLLRGYAGSLYQLARLIRQENLKVFSPKRICSAAETLTPFMRQTIEEVFESKVYDFYGSREVGPIAGECSHGKMHLFLFNNFTEVVDEQNHPVKPQQEGKLLVTTLHNFSMPLVRYDIGDRAVLGETSCECGNPLPTLERITGRVTDLFYTEDGNQIHGEYFTHLFYFREWVEEFQVLQKETLTIEIFYVPRTAPLQSDIDDIEDKIRLVMGRECRIQWTEVEEIPRTPQGKLLFTRSLLHPER